MKDKSPLYAQIHNQLKEQILSGKLRPGDRLPSENELAEHFGVSIITSKRALNELADESLIIRTKGKGSFVAGKDGSDILNSSQTAFRGVIGMVVPSICMPIESELFYYTQSMMHEAKYQTLIRVTDDRLDLEIEAIRMFSIFGVRGFIIFPAFNENYNEEIVRLSLNKFPHVLVDRYLPNINSSYVVSNNTSSTAAIIHYLWEKGHEKIAFLTQPDTNTNAHGRLTGFEKAYESAGKVLDKNSQYFERRSDCSDKEYQRQLTAFLTAHSEITAIVTMDAILASLAYEVLSILGKHIPDDITLISFDDPKLPFVPYVKQDIESIARRSTKILTEQIENKYTIVQEDLPMTFVKNVSYPLPFGLGRKAAGELIL
ncbi:GntR family transcriptional regulator [Hungatella sp.]|uniref:GntR family transcriptional regulator n=1 Tax=Hungatella sp. TaxID=2613924 RepID=UPI002A818E1D|nr:GntR family transcriptional regulator [Hungatella sp.]